MCHLLPHVSVWITAIRIGMNEMFKMPIGLYEKALPEALSWEERLGAAAQAGYDFVEISIDEGQERLSRLDWESSKKLALRRAIENSGVPIMTMCLSANRKYPLGSHDPSIRQQGQEIIRKAIDFAGEVGLRVVQVMAYDVFYEESDVSTRDNFLEGLHLAARWASQAGVMLGIENLDTPFADSLAKTMEIMKEIDSPWLQLYPDIGNLAAAGYSPPDELLLAENHVLGIHVKDSMPNVIRGITYGSGIVPFRETFMALAEIGFWGLLSVEMWGHMHPDKLPHETAEETYRFVEKIVNDTWPEHSFKHQMVVSDEENDEFRK